MDRHQGILDKVFRISQPIAAEPPEEIAAQHRREFGQECPIARGIARWAARIKMLSRVSMPFTPSLTLVRIIRPEGYIARDLHGEHLERSLQRTGISAKPITKP